MWQIVRMENTISFIIIVKNQANNIQNCIDSIVKYANEIIIVDTGSTDDTLMILDKNRLNSDKLHIYKHKWKNDFSDARNFALGKASCQWAFFMDADEILSKSNSSLREYFKYLNNIDNIEDKVISISRTSYDNIGSTHEYEDRIFKNNGKFHYYGYVHEEIRFSNNDVPPKYKSNIEVYHYGYMPYEMEIHKKIRRNVQLLLKNLDEEPQNQRWIYLISRDGQNEMESRELIDVIILGLFKNKKNFQLNDVLNLNNTQYKDELIVNLFLLYIDIKDLSHAELLLSAFKAYEIEENPDLLYCKTLIDIIKLYRIKNEILNHFISSRVKNFR